METIDLRCRSSAGQVRDVVNSILRRGSLTYEGVVCCNIAGDPLYTASVPQDVEAKSWIDDIGMRHVINVTYDVAALREGGKTLECMLNAATKLVTEGDGMAVRTFGGILTLSALSKKETVGI